MADGEENMISMSEDSKDPHHAMRRTATIDGHILKVNGTEPDPDAVAKARNTLRRTSSVANASDRESVGPKQRTLKPDIREHLKHLGPSNLASRPRQTRYNTVKIKPGAGSLVDGLSKSEETPETPRSGSVAAQGGVGAGLINSAGKDAKDGVLALQAGYGAIAPGSPSKKSRQGGANSIVEEDDPHQSLLTFDRDSRPTSKPQPSPRANSQSTLGSMRSGVKSPLSKRGAARSGSITENIIEAGGIKKTVLEMTSSSEEPEGGGAQLQADGASGEAPRAKENHQPGEGGGKKKRRRKKRKGGSESEDLLGDERV